MSHASPFLAFALLAPAVMVAPALAQPTPADEQACTAAQYYATYLASPKAWREADSHQTRFIINHLQQLEPLGEDDSDAVYLNYLQQDAQCFYLAEKSILSFDLNTIYRSYIQGAIQLQETYFESFQNHPTLGEQLPRLQQYGEAINRLRFEERYAAIKNELDSGTALSHISSILAEKKKALELAQTPACKGFLRQCRADLLSSINTYLDILNGRINLNTASLPTSPATLEELKRDSQRMMGLSVKEWHFKLKAQEGTGEDFDTDFILGDYQRKALTFAFAAAELRYIADTYEQRKNKNFDAKACYLLHMSELTPSIKEEYRDYWNQAIAQRSTAPKKWPTLADKKQQQQLQEQYPEAACYCSFIHADMQSFLTFYIPKDEITERCKELQEPLKAQLKVNPEQAADIIHYGSQIIYSRAQADILDDFARLYRWLAEEK